MQNVNYHITDTSITLTYSGKIRTVNRDTEVGEEVLTLIRESRVGEIPELIDMTVKISKASPDKEFQVIDGEVYCHGDALPTALSQTILKFMDEKLPIDIFLKFWKNLNMNPSPDSKEQFYRFLEFNHFPITPDGHFIAYKKVKENFKDHYTGKLDNSPGAVVEMPREDVNSNANQSCSTGLHIASYEYAKSFSGSIMLEVKVNPADVVSVPTDYKNNKCRCCRYQVIGKIDSEYKVTVVPKKAPATKPTKKTAQAKVVKTVTAIAEKKSSTTHSTSGNELKYPVPLTLENIQIGSYAYKATGVGKEDFDKAAKTFTKVKPSKWAAALKQINATTVYRKLLTKTKYDYFMKINGKYYRYKQLKTK